MLRVGLTGGIAAGKSHVLRRLGAAGFETLELDLLARDLMRPSGPAYDGVVAAFGPGILRPDGHIDRDRLGARVFADGEARSRLGAIVHPLVRAEEEARAAALAEGGASGLVAEAALLVEAGLHLRFDRLVVVHCGEEQQLERLRQRDGLDAESALRRIRAQMPGWAKRRFAQLEVSASGSLAETDREVDRVAARLEELASSPHQRVGVARERRVACLSGGPQAGPRGLSPARLLRAIVASGGVELNSLARLLDPPHAGPWYEAADDACQGPGPESLVAPVVLWALARRGDDPSFLLGAAFSVARLTHRRPGALAAACFVARALHDVAVRGAPPADLAGATRTWQLEAERWGGAPVGRRALALVRRALSPGSRDTAGQDLYGAFAGLLSGQTSSPARDSLEADLDALEEL